MIITPHRALVALLVLYLLLVNFGGLVYLVENKYPRVLLVRAAADLFQILVYGLLIFALLTG